MSMTDLLIQTSPGSNEKFRGYLDICRSSVIPRYSLDEKTSPPSVGGLGDLKHSKSDDLVLQCAPSNSEPELKHGISDATLEIQKDACVVYEEDILQPMSSLSSNILPSYHSDSETNVKSSYNDNVKPMLKITGDFGTDAPPSRRTSQLISICDRLDPEDSIRDIISENDFYRFVLFKRHYEKYMDISRKYEEARNLAYYLEEKYHEIKTERENLIAAQKDLERELESRDIELHEKEEELFLQLEKAVRLEEDCEKVRAEKDKMEEWKNRLQKERDEAYKQLRLQADAAEITRRRLERARNDVVQKVTAIVAEKDVLERENIRLKNALQDVERKYPTLRLSNSSDKRHGKTGSVLGLEKEVNDLKLIAKQSATLNSQLKKGMKHLATCRRRKCSVCSYTKSTFGEYASSDEMGRSKLITGCFPFHDLRRKVRHENGHSSDMFEDLAERLSQCSFQTPTTTTPPSKPYSHSPPLHLSYIDDDCSSGSEADIEEEQCHISTTSSIPPHAFSSDSGFSSELCDSALSHRTNKSSLQRATKWTSSFRKLIRRVSSVKKPSNNHNSNCHS